jgi:hypothetical protein
MIRSETNTLTGIPLEAYDYIVNGKPALDWVVERQRVKNRQGQRHCQRRQRLDSGYHEKSPLPTGTNPASHHGQPGNDEDRQKPAGFGDLKGELVGAR